MNKIELTNEQRDCVDTAVRCLNMNSPITVVAGPAGSGKAQPNDTLIPTPSGYKKLGDLVIGDKIFNRRGEETFVTGVFPQGIKEKYRITFGDNRVAYSSLDHLWTYITSKGNFKTEPLSFFIDNGLYNVDKRGRKAFKYSIPTNEAVLYSRKDFAIDPYVIGCFLGDGCCTERILTLSSGDEELVQEVAKLINAKVYSKNHENNYSWSFLFEDDCNEKTRPSNIYFLTSIFLEEFKKEMIVKAKDKRIPNKYKLGDLEQRLSLVQGLLDTDGCIRNGDRFNVSFSNTSLGLVQDLQEVLQSLGYSSTSISEDIREGREICYSLNINISNQDKHKLFRLKRKKEIAERASKIVKRKKYNQTTIRSIEKVGESEMTCISVDNEEQLYLTEHFVVTHNTTLVSYIVEETGLKRDEVAFATFTGKAALVLKRKGIKNASTIHSLIYKYVETPDGEFTFLLRSSLENPEIRLIVIDEISMVGEDLLEDLKSFNIKILALGDPYQLQPVLDKPTELLSNPDFLLKTIHRQAEGNPIIKFSQQIRETGYVFYKGENNEHIQKINKKDLNIGMLLWADQILCSTHRIRRQLNNSVRDEKGFKTNIPDIGDKLICLKNYKFVRAENSNETLVNGMIGYVTQIFRCQKEGMMPYMDIEFRPEYDQSTRFEVRVDLTSFLGLAPYRERNLRYQKRPRCQFDFGYAITIHKSQGSEWDNVLVYAGDYFGDTAKLAYTAVTRAQNKLVYIE